MADCRADAAMMSRLERLQQLAQACPDDALAQYGLALEYINQQQWGDAVGAFDRAIAVDAKYSAAYYHKARAQIAAGDSQQARATLAAGIEVSGTAGDWKTQNEMRELLETID